MTSLLSKKKIYTVGGYMLDKFKYWFIVKCWTIWYYITHPSMYWKRLLVGDTKLKKVLDLYVGMTMSKEKK